MSDTLSKGWLHLAKHFEEFTLAHSACFLLKDIPLCVRDDRVRRSADTVTSYFCGRARSIHVNHDRDVRRIDRSRHLLIRPDVTFHDPTRNAPLAGEEEDDGLAGLDRLLLSRSVVFRPSDAVGRDIEAVPGVGE